MIRRAIVPVVAAAVTAAAGGARALPRPALSPAPPAALAVELEERPGARVPGELVFRDQDGRTVRLGDYLGRGRPVLLTLAYYRCPMLCDLVLKGLAQTLRRIGWAPGREYEAVTVSIDEKDTPGAARVRQIGVLQAMGHPDARAGWSFLVHSGSEPGAARRLADVIGYRYAYDRASDQYAHPAAAVVLAPDGRVSRYLHGIDFRPLDVRLAMAEAAEGRIGTGIVARMLLTCFRYDPSTRRYGFVVTAVLKGGSALVVLTLTGVLVLLWRRDRARQRSSIPPARRA